MVVEEKPKKEKKEKKQKNQICEQVASCIGCYSSIQIPYLGVSEGPIEDWNGERLR